jgi:hypothetical protein
VLIEAARIAEVSFPAFVFGTRFRNPLADEWHIIVLHDYSIDRMGNSRYACCSLSGDRKTAGRTSKEIRARFKCCKRCECIDLSVRRPNQWPVH